MTNRLDLVLADAVGFAKPVNKRNKIHFRIDETGEFNTWLASYVLCEENSDEFRYHDKDGFPLHLRTTTRPERVTCLHCRRKLVKQHKIKCAWGEGCQTHTRRDKNPGAQSVIAG